MKKLDRRNFLQTGAGGAASLALLGALPGLGSSAVQAAGRALGAAFAIEPGALMRLDWETRQALSITPWAIPASDAALLPALLQPASFAQPELDAWLARDTQQDAPRRGLGAGRRKPDRISYGALDDLMTASIGGHPDVTDIIGESVFSLHNEQRLDLTLDFLHQAERPAVPAEFLSVEQGLPLIQTPAWQPLPTGAATGLEQLTPPSVTLFGWRLQVRGPDYHPLRPCVSTSVNHFNLEVMRQTSPGRFAYVANFHLGAYRENGRVCLVLFNNVAPQVCWKICNPTLNDLARMLTWVLLAAAAVAGIVIAGYIVIALANTAAAVLWVPLRLLV